jgi:hypothetical protein
MIDNIFLESIKTLSTEEQNLRLKLQLEYISDEYEKQIIFLHSQISKYSALYNECQEKLYNQ